MKVFKNWVFRRTFGPKRERVTGEWGEVHNEKLNNLKDTQM
jgi:hypothetical protein